MKKKKKEKAIEGRKTLVVGEKKATDGTNIDFLIQDIVKMYSTVNFLFLFPPWPESKQPHTHTHASTYIHTRGMMEKTCD